MMRPTATASAVLLLACGGEPTGPVGRTPTGGSFQYTYSDPVGDTLPPPQRERPDGRRDVRVASRRRGGHMLRRIGETDEWREVRIEFSSRSLILRFARADVAETDGAFRVSAMIGGTNREITDLAPDSGHYRVPR